MKLSDVLELLDNRRHFKRCPESWSYNTDSGNVRFEVSTAVTMKNAVFWDVTPSGSCKA
jgi:hypothetical protein